MAVRFNDSVLRLRLQRETLVMGGTCAFIAVLFFVTAIAVHAYNARVNLLSIRWGQRGARALAAGNAELAIADLRNALAYDPRNTHDQLALAQALSRVGKPDEARAYLLHLWRQEPGDGVVNLELARLSARQGGIEDALRYFHNAIYGVWEAAPDDRRREVRFELSDFLLQHDRHTQADAELIALLPSLPRQAEAYRQTGDLFLRAVDYERALEQFRRALRIDSDDVQAAFGAGQAAFDLGNMRIAEEYLKKTAAMQPGNIQAQSMLLVLKQARSLDPFGFRLTKEQRAARVKTAFALAVQRLQQCIALRPSDVASIQAEISAGNALGLQISQPEYLYMPDAVDSTMSFVFDAEALSNKNCGAPQGMNLALQLIAKARESR